MSPRFAKSMVELTHAYTEALEWAESPDALK